ncbi:MAG: DNA polymerase III subunit gamma/tau [Gemmatimonadales bacterium]|jgi:DNA polymerase-3 subunit gamma/tau
MSHQALARKYRPKRFADLVAQSHVAVGLAGAVAKSRAAHAYLLTGPRGVGKTSAARILAMALNCEARTSDGEPCGTCDSCCRIWSGAANLDVVEIDAASNRGVDDARELRERATYAASGADRYKVYIIDEAHMLTREAWNALLKILEEPPPHVVFVFATTEPQKIANTAAPVMSRLQRFDFRRIGPTPISDRLRYVAEQEGIAVDDDALVVIARAARGGMRDGLSILDQTLAFGEGTVTADRVREALGLIGDEMYAELLELVADRRSADVFPFVQRLVDAGADLGEFVIGAGETLRSLMVAVLGGEPAGLTDVLRSAVERHGERFTEGDVLRMLRLLGETETAIRRSPLTRLHVETLLLQWTLLDRTVELAELLDRLGGGPEGGEPSRPPVPRTAGGRRAKGRSGDRSPPSGAVGGERAGGRPSSAQGGGPVAERAAPAAAPVPPVGEGPLTLETLRRAWPAVVEAVGSRRRMVRESLGHARPAALEGDELALAVDEGAGQLEGLERSRREIARAIQAVTGRSVRVALRVVPAVEAADAAAEPRRLDENSDRQERLQHYRRKDASLDAVADALDLELLE